MSGNNPFTMFAGQYNIIEPLVQLTDQLATLSVTVDKQQRVTLQEAEATINNAIECLSADLQQLEQTEQYSMPVNCNKLFFEPELNHLIDLTKEQQKLDDHYQKVRGDRKTDSFEVRRKAYDLCSRMHGSILDAKDHLLTEMRQKLADLTTSKNKLALYKQQIASVKKPTVDDDNEPSNSGRAACTP